MQKFRRVFEGIAKAGQSTDLNDFYTELFITERVSGEVNKEHEVRLIETASRKPAKEETPIKLEDIFKPLPGQDQPSRTIMTTGVAGIGKTILTHKFTLDWAEGKANQDIHFTLPFTFRELNLLKEKEFSLMELLHHFFIQTKGILRYDLFQVVFILDGLDECRLPLDFQNNPIWTDVTKSTSVDVLLTNLIRGDLLPSARIWITTRPAAANQIPAKCVGMVTEVRGFTDPQKDEYFRKRFREKTLAITIISHIKTSRSLHIILVIVSAISGPAGGMPAGVSPEEGGGEKLSRRHAVRLSPAAQVSVEECSLAVGEKVGYKSVKFAARMNRAVVVFLDSIDKVNSVVESGVAIRDVYTQVMPLFNSARRVMISNAPPFLSNEALGRELGRYGLLVSPIRMVSLGCKSPHLKHVLSFRRNTFMILKNNEADLDLVMKFKAPGGRGGGPVVCRGARRGAPGGAAVAAAEPPVAAAVPPRGPGGCRGAPGGCRGARRGAPGGCRGARRGAPGGCRGARRGAPGGCRGAPGGCRGPPVAAAEPPVAAAVPAAGPPVAAAVPAAGPPVAAAVPPVAASVAAAVPPVAASVAAAVPPVAASVPVAGPLVDIAVAPAVTAISPTGSPHWCSQWGHRGDPSGRLSRFSGGQ
ncbi:hypothetical protein NHX12_015823 [Muraenolepis orangiensis]|uniref:NACHT domain-containing protein n=1 Tax=Muraenolepis orangiensis TaxID=630683 RepID=A0A9Q0D6Q4_9TELE|nr:hypothetical protein NHX12_015823 [Muraenolepis orangiensis]